jgi:hypothetical protein
MKKLDRFLPCHLFGVFSATLRQLVVIPKFLRNCSQIQKDIADVKHGKDVTLSVDEMSIKKALCYDPQLKKYLGFTDFPDDKQSSRETDHQLLATQILVFYVVGLDGKWRSPVAYYFTTHLTGLRQSKMLYFYGFFFRTPTIDSQPSPAFYIDSILFSIIQSFNQSKLMARRIDLPCFFENRPRDGVAK